MTSVQAALTCPPELEVGECFQAAPLTDTFSGKQTLTQNGALLIVSPLVSTVLRAGRARGLRWSTWPFTPPAIPQKQLPATRWHPSHTLLFHRSPNSEAYLQSSKGVLQLWTGVIPPFPGVH